MKNIKRHVFIMLIYAILVLNFTNASSETEPVLNIKGNGIANQITLKPSDTLSLKVDMEPGSLLGSNADWWIVAKTPSGDWYSWVYPTGWINIGTDLYAISVTYQGALFALSPFEVLNASNLAEGDYDLYFGIDTNMNGVLDYQSLSYSALKVSVSSANSTGGFLLPPASGGNPSFTSEHFSGSANCTMCHNGLNDQNGLDVSIETDWSSTMMANATRDPFWKAKVRSELNRNPQLSSVINDNCSRCHAPMANFEARNASESLEILDEGFLKASHPRHDEAMNGVGCTACHQIKNSPDLGTLSRFSGKYEIDGSKTIYGQYDGLFPNPMIMNTGYTPTYSPHVKSSKLCATCHNLKTPYVDESGTVLSTTPESEFPEQMPYTEWEHSSYASTNPKSCQQCHMSRANGVPISNRPIGLEGRNDFAIHEFVGANKLMLDVFDKNKQQLGVLANNFAETIGKTQTMLNSAASIAPVSQSLANNTLNFKLKINSNTGHKLPSAYPSRRVILHVTVKDSQGTVVFESGKVNANGSVVGVAADADRATFEPHYDLITSPDQVQAYEAIMGNNQNQVTYTLLRGATYLKDNRLLPQGFDKATAPNDVKVKGGALTDANFIGGSDEITYQISGLNNSAYQVEAELLHQPIAYAFAQDLFTEVDGEVEDFKTMFNASSLKSSRITVYNFTVAQ